MAVQNIALAVILMIVSANASPIILPFLLRLHQRAYQPYLGDYENFDGLRTDFGGLNVSPRYSFLRRFTDGNLLPFNSIQPNFGVNRGSVASSAAAASAAAGGAPSIGIPRVYRHVSEIGAIDNDAVLATGTHGSSISFEN